MSVIVAFDEQELAIFRQERMPAGKFGQPIGTWFWTGAVLGDATGGVISISFSLSEAIKNRWVLSLVNGTLFTNADPGAVFGSLVWNSGPIYRDSLTTGATNPSWAEIQAVNRNTTLNQGTFTPRIAVDERLIGIGEPQLTGNFIVCTWVQNGNINTVTYMVAMWGLLYAWQTFARGRAP